MSNEPDRQFRKVPTEEQGRLEFMGELQKRIGPEAAAELIVVISSLVDLGAKTTKREYYSPDFTRLHYDLDHPFVSLTIRMNDNLDPKTGFLTTAKYRFGYEGIEYECGFDDEGIVQTSSIVDALDHRGIRKLYEDDKTPYVIVGGWQIRLPASFFQEPARPPVSAFKKIQGDLAELAQSR